jgi:hypothetical protein
VITKCKVPELTITTWSDENEASSTTVTPDDGPHVTETRVGVSDIRVFINLEQ